MNEEFNNSSIDTELQVRLMNLVMDEASDFERDQLQLLMEQRTEVAAYYQNLEHLHRLLCKVGVGESSIDASTSIAGSAWKLHPDRRARVLAVFDNPKIDLQDKVTLASKSDSKSWHFTMAQIAAVALTACVLLGLILFPVQSTMTLARRPSSKLAGGMEGTLFTDEYSPSNGIATPEPPMAAVALSDGATTSAGLPNVYYTQPSDAPGKTSEKFGQTLSENVASFEPNQADTKPFARPIPPAAPAMEGFTMGKEWQANRFGEPTLDAPAGGDANGNKGVARFRGRTNGRGGIPSSEGRLDVGKATELKNPDGADNFSHDIAQAGRGLATTNPISNWNDDGLSRKLGSAVDATNSEITNWDEAMPTARAESYAVDVSGEKPTEPTATDRKQILLGDIGSNREASVPEKLGRYLNQDFDASPMLLQSVTPKLLVQDEEEIRLADSSKETPPIPLFDGEQKAPNGPNVSDPSRVSSSSDGRQDFGLLKEERGSAVDAGLSLSNEQPEGKSKGYLYENQSMIDGLFGDVTTESVEDINLFIVRGIEADVERVKDRVKSIKDGVANTEFEQLENIAALEKKESNSHWSIESGSIDSLSSKLDADHTTRLYRAQPKQDERLARGSSSEIALEQNADFIYDRRVKDSSKLESDNVKKLAQSDGESHSKEQEGEVRLGWKFTPTPSPQVASKDRDKIKAESKPVAPKQSEAIDEQTASSEPFSTFSLHVSDVSFKLAQAALGQGQWPDASKIRIEEFVNALDYHDPLPGGNQKVACRIEQAIHPFLMQRNLLRVSMRTAATGRAQNTPLRLTLLLDNSGSMERPDRRQAVLRAFQTLTQQLSASDQITLISFASTPRLLADKVPGNQGETLLQLIENLPSEGGTNIEAALTLAQEKAIEQKLSGAQNRVVLFTDGAVNLGNANPESLAKLVTQMRDTGIAFDAAGISAQDLNDEVLETLTRQGDGRYYLLDSAESVGESFASQIAGALRPSAQNVKVQIEFNPQRVGRYKLLGFEKHRLNKEDFRNDKVDAAEMAAAEAGVAVYQFEIKPNGSGDVGNASVRFRDLSTGQMVERRWPIPYEPNAPSLDQAEVSMKLAASAALFAAKLSGGPLGDSVDLAPLQKLLSNLSDQFSNQPRVQQLRSMVEQAIAIGK